MSSAAKTDTSSSTRVRIVQRALLELAGGALGRLREQDRQQPRHEQRGRHRSPFCQSEQDPREHRHREYVPRESVSAQRRTTSARTPHWITRKTCSTTRRTATTTNGKSIGSTWRTNRAFSRQHAGGSRLTAEVTPGVALLRCGRFLRCSQPCGVLGMPLSFRGRRPKSAADCRKYGLGTRAFNWS